ncbi:MAG: 3-keto-5-aminohexanoate cleavage protein [Chloroflexi bacterium]|nr:3-keto-5-aminohexanoate cleavage protein [Chloroflexota bacterium]
MPAAPVIIEAAINGATPKTRNPAVPRSPAEVAAEGLRGLAAGAAIVHNHNDEPVVGGRSGVHDPAPYIEAWRAILAERPDALLYPTMASGGPHTTISERYAHIPALAEAGVLRVGLVDPGSVNVGGADHDGLPAAIDATYVNTFADARHMFETCAALDLGPSISCFEPGFVRVVLRYWRAGRLPAGSLVKFYFGGEYVNFGLPPTAPSLDAYLAMIEGTGLTWSVAVLGGDVVGCGLARLALERGGHVRVGLEDYAGPRTPTNVDLIGELVALCGSVGRPVATCGEAAAILGLPRSPGVR